MTTTPATLKPSEASRHARPHHTHHGTGDQSMPLLTRQEQRRLETRKAWDAKTKRATDARIDPHAAPGDQQRLRLLPALGPGMGGGAVPGTRPDHIRIRLNRRKGER